MRFPLNTTPDDVLDLCGPGVYRVYTLDAFGEQLSNDHLSRWDLSSSSLHELRNSSSADPILGSRIDRTPPTSDLRFALEAMTQMMRTNTDALRLVAESHVDLAKTIATVKGLPRNAAMYQPPALTAGEHQEYEDEEDEDEDDEPVDARPTNYLDVLMPISKAIAPQVAEMFPGFVMGVNNFAAKAGSALRSKINSKSPTASNDDIASRPFEMRELVDLGYAHRKGEAQRAATQESAEAGETLQARLMRDAQLRQKVFAIKNSLAPDEVEILISAAGTMPPAAQTKFMETIKPLSLEDAVAYCREVVKTIRAHEMDANDSNNHQPA